jgi:hypothetical protein
MAALPPLPKTFLRPDLEAAGFVGWMSWAGMRIDGFAELPRRPGSYVLYRDTADAPSFVEVGSGGRFKARDPNIPTATLARNWVAGARTVYIGKATTLRSRLRTFADFGTGRPVGHCGGRYIWQLNDAPELLVAWRQLATPELARADEVALLAHFRDQHDGDWPFANLTG